MVTKESAKVSSLPADKQQYDFVKLVTVTHEDVIPTSTTFVFVSAAITIIVKIIKI